MGDFTDLVCIGRILSQTSLELEIFFPTYNGVRFFFSIIRHERYFFPKELICMLFSSRNQSAGHFFRNHPYPPQKSNGRPLKSTKHLVS